MGGYGTGSGSCPLTVFGISNVETSGSVTTDLRAGVHAPIKLVSVPAPISFIPPVKPMSAVHTDRQNRYRHLQGGQFRE